MIITNEINNVFGYCMLGFYGVLILICVLIIIDQIKIDGKQSKNK